MSAADERGCINNGIAQHVWKLRYFQTSSEVGEVSFPSIRFVQLMNNNSKLNDGGVS